MTEFWFYFQLGYKHVLDVNAYDHVLFLVSLTVGFTIKQWKWLLGLVTIFTIGHTISLVVSYFHLFDFPSTIIEFLIPVSIIFTSILVIFTYGNLKRNRFLYFITFFFGVIHGFGFAKYFHIINDSSDAFPLLYFALGIEFSQLIIVSILLVLGYIIKRIFKISNSYWIIFISILVIAFTIPLLINNWIF